MNTSMRGPYTGPRGGVYYIDANGNKQYGDPTAMSSRSPQQIAYRVKQRKALKALGGKRPWKNYRAAAQKYDLAAMRERNPAKRGELQRLRDAAMEKHMKEYRESRFSASVASGFSAPPNSAQLRFLRQIAKKRGLL